MEILQHGLCALRFSSLLLQIYLEVLQRAKKTVNYDDEVIKAAGNQPMTEARAQEQQMLINYAPMDGSGYLSTDVGQKSSVASK